MAEPVPAKVPRQIGRYRVERRLGSGGMGVVYLCADDAGRPVAVKLIRPEFIADHHFRARLRRELEAARRVPRTCTAPVLDADLDGDPPWVATEFINGPTLDVAVLERGPLRGPDLLAFAAGVALALRAIHEQAVIHRDLKPSNIVLSPVGPRVIDFGIARIAASGPEASTQLTLTGAVLGTPAYMAPEQARGETVTAAADLFAWGRVVWFAATGRPPAGPDPDRHHGTEPAAMPEPLRELVAAALSADPAQRPTAADVVQRLQRSDPAATTQVLAAAATLPPTLAGGGQPQQATTVPGPGQVPRPATAGRRSRRWLVGAAATGLIAAIVALTVLWWPTREPASPGFGTQIGAPVSGLSEGYQAGIGTLAGDPVAVFGSPDRTVQVWNLRTGEQVGEPLTGHRNVALAAAVGEVDGLTLAVTASNDETVRLWDLRTGQPIGAPLVGHGSQVTAVATGQVDGVPVAVSGSDEVLVWNLRTRELLAELSTDGHAVDSVALAEVDGVPVAVAVTVTLQRIWQITLWSLRSFELVDTIFPSLGPSAGSVAIGQVEGTTVAVIGGIESVNLVSIGLTLQGGSELTTQPGSNLEGHTGRVAAVATGQIDGRPVAVSGGEDMTVRVWDLVTGEQIGPPFEGHTGAVTQVALSELDGSPVVVSGGADGTIRVWSLAGPPATG